ncbi:hypothetical protein SLEP1_g48741 [Rubroshorea leprosula]|uniref:Uncharacterized protein n=1 Tax=Rubroshorea leprosula TaxID=152421 RepID=A0AAV5LVG5_9ROSI|nr:hypothetical protein SLEP1_g48741 [Rubroshorea leprosula]
MPLKREGIPASSDFKRNRGTHKKTEQPHRKNGI